MTLQLSGNTERRRNQYEPFPGRPIDTMPVLIEQGYDPASIAVVIDRRINAPEEVRQAWNNQYFWTGDAASTDGTGGAVLTLDAPTLQTIHLKSTLYNGALQLNQDRWEAVKQADTSETLSADEVNEAHGKGFKKQGGLWLPVNASVGKVMGHYLREKSFEDRDFQAYAQRVSDASDGSEEIFNQYFDQSRPSTPHQRSVVVGRTDGRSGVGGGGILDTSNGFLVGVAPEAPVARKKELEERVASALELGREFAFEGKLYVPVDPSVADRLQR